MDAEAAKIMRDRLEARAVEQVNSSLNSMREELSKSNEEAAKMLDKKGQEPKEEDKYQVEYSVKPSRGLIYFSAPQDTPWVAPLKSALNSFQDMVFHSRDLVANQFQEDDILSLNEFGVHVVKSLCGVFHIPEETLAPFDSVRALMMKADQGDGACLIFSRLWFLVRSSVVVCDLMQSPDLESSQTLLYCRQLGIPVIGLMPANTCLDAWTHRSMTTIFTQPDISQLLPMVRGFVG